MRNPYISALQAFGILLVVAGHAFATDGHDSPVYRWIYSFHMPLWVFLSGYLLRYTAPSVPQGECPICRIQTGGTGGFIARKARRLLIPYILISTLVFLPKVWLSHWAVKPVELTWGAYFDTLLVPAHNVIVYYWFLPTIFILLVGAVLGGKLVNRLSGGRPLIPFWIWPVVALALSVFNPLGSIEWLNLAGVVKFSFFFALGMAYCNYQPRLEQMLSLDMPWTCLGWLATSIVLVVTGYGSQNLLFSQLAAVTGILFVLSLGRLYLNAGSRFLAPLDGATYAIFLFSWFPQSALRVLLYDQWGLTPWAVVPISTIAGIVLPWLLYKWLQRIKKYQGGKTFVTLLGQ